ncbi:hypothetical protein J1605_018361 [Eschrichtius robustus]|uniref:Uncharacterized protein n=1 Tax=Eschrichtius robustus TaxID=9764 RepID=A0AB34HUH8_ESCRO|nr:hypothetical protein J1605_018361 [Eschrichtius robustus]
MMYPLVIIPFIPKMFVSSLLVPLPAFCEDDELECANHECVSRDRWCDGEADCVDSSDEWDCVTLSANVNSSSFLTAHRSAVEHHVCADGWQETLSQLACKQMGLG